MPAPPGAVELVDLGSDDPEESGPPAADLETTLRRARHPALVTVPASIRAGRVSVSSSAVVAVLALVVALGCAFVVRILWAERAAQDGQVLGGAHGARDVVAPVDGGPASPQVVSGSAPAGPGESATGWPPGSAPGLAGGGPDGGPAAGARTELVVHVVGQVRRPGLVRLSGSARVADAITAAGGATRTADLAALNLARALVDGEQVFVPRPGEKPPPAAGSPAPGSAGGGPGVVGAPGSGAASGLVNLNTADLAALETLPGVGPVLGQRIVDWRSENGRFTSVEELGEVSGIGDKMLAQLRPKVTV
ncbi:hypothetical protein IDVR_29390 [Intrasporangium sp. DVR]